MGRRSTEKYYADSQVKPGFPAESAQPLGVDSFSDMNYKGIHQAGYPSGR